MTRTATRALTVAATVVAAAGVCAVFAASFSPRLVSRAELPLYGIDLVPVTLGWLVTVRAPSSPTGPALAWTGAATLGTRMVEIWGETYGTGAPWWGASVVAVIGPGFWPWQLMGFLWLMLVFPSGLLPGRRWRVVAWSGPVAAVLITIGLAGAPADATPTTWRLAFLLPGLALLLVSLLGAVASLWVRRRHGDDRTRQQLRWVVFAGAEKRLLHRLSVFTGPFDRPAATRVAADPDVSPGELDDLIEGLVMRSMLTSAPGPTGRRFRLLEPIRQYAAACLDAEGHADQVAARHSRWCVEEVGRIHLLLAGQEEVEGVQQLEALWPNLRTAVR